MLRCLVVLSGCLLMVGCAARPNELRHVPCDDGSIAGFWLGLWHGMISGITFFISLFTDSVTVYEVHNNGGWYNFGFLLGAGVQLGSCSCSSKKSK